ncbi:hypothetical protein D1164_16010 [Mariniphaga sediminis]|jgi:hypothetical protein|uniref:Outer membrane protein beta-barrel domain-containing protein n=1 Tax=Mariniphaga sediminis TaxID=1628158 RepID=A0A399D117_9BACT|nr:hypothetical protein [Mariniphaga sediminis]RIH64070.1 hypothetical protein D1164_16010 [Mariniphaga sediminis]
MMKKVFLASTLFLLVVLSANAQDYNTGIGVRGGLSNGLTVKHFIESDRAIEGLLSSRWRGFNITGLYEIHAQAFDTPRLNWYYGFGGHIGFWDGYDDHPWFDDNDNYTVVGIDGIIGIEYNIEPIPFNISLDWKPGFNIIGYTGFWGDEIALSVRFIW